MRYALALVCGTVVLLSLVSLNAAPGKAQSGWQPRVQALESLVGELHAENAALQNELEELATQLDALAMQLDDHAADPDAHHSPPDLSDLEDDVDDLEDLLMHFGRDGDDVFIEGANLHVTNGLGSTDTINGLGNIIIGYNEERDGLEADIAGNLISRYGEEWAMLDAEVKDRIMSEETRAAVLGEENDRSGSHVLVVGTGLNYSSFGGIVTGFANSTSGRWSSVLGGAFNEASGLFSVVAGGGDNEATRFRSAVAGGEGNVANGEASLVSEGCNRTVTTCGGP